MARAGCDSINTKLMRGTRALEATPLSFDDSC